MKKLVLFLTSAFCFLTAASAAELTVTVEDSVRMAMQNNLQVKQAERTLAQTKRAKSNSWNSASPSIAATGSFTIPLLEEQRNLDVNTSWSVGATASLALHPSLFSSIRGAKLNYEQGLMTYEESLRTVELNVRKIFYGILLQMENIETQKRSMEAARRQYETNREKYNKGQIPELELLSSQVNYESKRPGIQSQENTLANNIASFKMLIGVDQNTDLTLSGSLEGFDSFDENRVDFNVYSTPSVKSLQKNVDILNNALLATRFAAWGPSFSATYQISGGNAMGMTSGPMATGREDFKLTTHMLSLGVRIPLDGYLPWSSGANSIANQKDSLANLKETLENAKVSVSVSVENNLRTINQALNQLKSLEQTVALAQKTYELTQTAYNHGSRDWNALKNAEDSYISAKTSLMAQNYTLITAILDLENTLGVPFGTLVE